MRGRMMAFPLTVPALLRRTDTFWRDREVVSRAADRSVARTTYGAEAAVVAIPDDRWQERPLALVVLRPGASVTPEDLRAFLEPQFVKWWLPDAYEVVESLPRTPTGKLLKYALRERYKDYKVAETGA
jgi:acyl-CoA synthetase (AMP-forming)/AMP-acid ligase II